MEMGGLPALKSAMSASGVECGPPRLPLRSIELAVVQRVRALLDERERVSA